MEIFRTYIFIFIHSYANSPASSMCNASVSQRTPCENTFLNGIIE